MLVWSEELIEIANEENTEMEKEVKLPQKIIDKTYEDIVKKWSIA